MEKILLLAMIAISTMTYGQRLNVTPEGLRDSTGNTFVIIDAEGKTTKQLFDNALKYLHKSYKNPEAVIKGNIDGEYLRYVTHIDNFLVINNSGVNINIDANYSIELSFKDGKVKFEVSELNMYWDNGESWKVLFTGSIYKGYPIYNKKGKLIRPDTKTEIEAYFNATIAIVKGFLLGKNNDW